MATHANSVSLPAWAPKGAADWAPLAVSVAIILSLATALILRPASPASAVPNGKAGEDAAATASALPPLKAGTPALSTERVGTLRLVPTAKLPTAKQRVQADSRCPRPAPSNLSPQAKEAMTAGWHVSADTTVSGFRIVMVDSGVKKVSAGCAAIGASALVFNAGGLIAIAYDRNVKQSSRLGPLTILQTGVLQLGALKGPLAELSVSDQQIRLRPLTTDKRNRSSR